jgi:hypothetical protein
MNQYFEKLINKLYKKDIDSFFGTGSTIVIDTMGYSTQLKKIHMSVVLIPTDYDLSIEIFPEALEILILDAWKFLSLDTDYVLTTSIKK